MIEALRRLFGPRVRGEDAKFLRRAAPRAHKPDGISVRYYEIAPKQFENSGFIAVLSFHGSVPDGSAGRDHAHFVATETIYWMTHLDANAVVLDFRDLDYVWGNSMLAVFQRVHDHFHHLFVEEKMAVPVHLLASDRSRGLYSLLANDDVFHETVEAALKACDADIQRWFDAN